jgi:hypothetical protein
MIPQAFKKSGTSQHAVNSTGCLLFINQDMPGYAASGMQQSL